MGLDLVAWMYGQQMLRRTSFFWVYREDWLSRSSEAKSAVGSHLIFDNKGQNLDKLIRIRA